MASSKLLVGKRRTVLVVRPTSSLIAQTLEAFGRLLNVEVRHPLQDEAFLSALAFSHKKGSLGGSHGRHG